jgi:hypothetical protein
VHRELGILNDEDGQENWSHQPSSTRRSCYSSRLKKTKIKVKKIGELALIERTHSRRIEYIQMREQWSQ